jgi:diguanylate cyclase (GGDEF)-like protein
MPGPVWTMALWFGTSAVVLALAMASPMSLSAATGPLVVAMLYALGVAVALLVMKARTPTWFILAQTAVASVACLWIVYVSVTPQGAVTSSIGLVAVAAYLGFWMTIRVAVALTAASSAILLTVFAATDHLPGLLVPWLLVSALSLGLVVSIGTLVSRLNHLVVTDPLTGLLNRSGLEMLIDLQGGIGRVVEPRSVIVIDLDDFKELNDREGHLAGDGALREFGDAIRDVIRPDDIAIRSGGDEFVLVLPQTDRSGATSLATRLRRATQVGWSYGVTSWKTNETLDDALARADHDMYQQKAHHPDQG